MQTLSRLAHQITNYKLHDPPFTLAAETVYATEVQVWRGLVYTNGVKLWVIYRIAMQFFSHRSGKLLLFILSTLSTAFSIVILSLAWVNCIMLPNWELKSISPRYIIAL